MHDTVEKFTIVIGKCLCNDTLKQFTMVTAVFKFMFTFMLKIEVCCQYARCVNMKTSVSDKKSYY